MHVLEFVHAVSGESHVYSSVQVMYTVVYSHACAHVCGGLSVLVFLCISFFKGLHVMVCVVASEGVCI